LKASDFEQKPDLFIAALGEKSQSKALEWACALNMQGIKAETAFGDSSLKSQMKRADKLAAPYVLIVGDKELEEGAVLLRNMATKEQVSVPIDNVVETLKANSLKIK